MRSIEQSGNGSVSLPGPGGAAVATSELDLDLLPVCDLSAAFAPLSSFHPSIIELLIPVGTSVSLSVHGLAVTLEGGGQTRGKSGVTEETGRGGRKLDTFRPLSSEVILFAALHPPHPPSLPPSVVEM